MRRVFPPHASHYRFYVYFPNEKVKIPKMHFRHILSKTVVNCLVAFGEETYLTVCLGQEDRVDPFLYYCVITTNIGPMRRTTAAPILHEILRILSGAHTDRLRRGFDEFFFFVEYISKITSATTSRLVCYLIFRK